MEMNFPHSRKNSGSAAQGRLRALDMDILRVLAFAPVRAGNNLPVQRSAAKRDPGDRVTALMAFFAGARSIDKGLGGSFNGACAEALARAETQVGWPGQQGEQSVYQCASVNRKAVAVSQSQHDFASNKVV